MVGRVWVAEEKERMKRVRVRVRVRVGEKLGRWIFSIVVSSFFSFIADFRLKRRTGRR